MQFTAINSPVSKVVMGCAFVMFAICSVKAKTCVWTGAGQPINGRHQLFDSANWEGNVVPEDGDTLHITLTGATPININKPGYTFENIIYSNSFGSDFGVGSFTLTGTESKITAAGKNVYVGVEITLAQGAKIELCQEGGSAFSFNSNVFKGFGEIVVTGSRAAGSSTDQTIGLNSNPNFHGTWSIYRPVWVKVNVDNPFGADDATVNIYGENGESNKAGKLSLAGCNIVSGEINFFDKSSLSITGTSGPLSNIVTFNGNVTYIVKNQNYRQLDISVGTSGKEYTSGYIFKKNLVCEDTGNKPYMNVYTYSRGTYYFEVRGVFNPTDSDSNPFGMGLLSNEIPPEEQLAEVYLGNTVDVRHVYRLAPRSYNHYHTMRANILPTGNHGIWVGFSSRVATTPDSYLDLHGYDQTVATFRYADTTKVYDFAVQSTGRPATLKVGNSEATAQVVPLLKGHVSIYGYALASGNGAHLFSKKYDTSGWIGTEKNTLQIESTASFLNLGGIECTGAGSVVLSSGAVFNPNMTLDVHDMKGGKVRIPTGVNLNVKHVFAENVDLPAGVYCRTGAGIEGATEVEWLNKANSDSDEMKGTVTVSAHDPVWIWTGKGSSSSFTDGANWGANLAPDLTNARLTLNLKNAAGKAAVPLNGIIAPAGGFNCGDYSKGDAAVTFNGSGTLVLGDSGLSSTNDLKMVFTESTSFTWNGSGVLYLTGKSTTLGTLTVNSGKVIMDYASWVGPVVVAKGAELVVNTNCGSEVFGGAEDNVCEISLDGRLTLGAEIAASVHALKVGGGLVQSGKTYGSSNSSAVRIDDRHFGGFGTIDSQLKRGVFMILR